MEHPCLKVHKRGSLYGILKRIASQQCCVVQESCFHHFQRKNQVQKVNIPSSAVCTTKVNAWMDEERMLEWIDKVWSPYVKACCMS